jgi:hypothetical protein
MGARGDGLTLVLGANGKTEYAQQASSTGVWNT